MRTLLLGLDGYDDELAARLMQAGHLPNLARLQARSARIPLDHGGARRTGLAWEHFATGLSPDDCGRYAAVDFDAQRYRATQRGTNLPTFTRHLDAPVLVFDAPYFDLRASGQVTGSVGWGAHDPGVAPHSVPGELARQIEQRFGGYPARPWIYGHTWPDVEATERMGHDLVKAVELRTRITEWLLTEHQSNWQVALVVVSELHSAVEALWHGFDDHHPLAALPSAGKARTALLETYRAVDTLVGRLIARLPDARIVAFNLHGMGPNQSDLTSMALLPELLYRRSFGEARLNAGRVDAATGLVLQQPNESWSDAVRHLFDGPNPTGKPRGKRSWRSVRRKVRELRRRKSTASPVTTVDWMPAAWYAPWWFEMDAFALPSFYDGRIRINLAGREAQGRVEPAQYEAVRDALETLLRACTDPRTGDPAVRDIVRPKQNPLTMDATGADIIIVWNTVADALEHPEFGTIGPLPYRRPGGHTGGHGIALVAAPDIEAASVPVQDAFDLLPTLFDWHGAPYPEPLTGTSFLPQIGSPPRA